MRKIVLTVLMMLLFGVCSVQAVDITFSTSGTISNGDLYDTVYVENDFTVVDMLGGQIGNLTTSDASTFNMSGGQITDRHIDIDRLSTINISNGTIDLGDFVVRGLGSISGGNISAVHFKTYSESIVNIHGGNLSFGTFVFNEVYIYGGHFNVDDTYVGFQSTITIYGYNFNYDPTGGTLEGILTGYLMDGNPFILDNVNETEYLHFNLIPEPTTLLLLGLGGLFLRRRG